MKLLKLLRLSSRQKRLAAAAIAVCLLATAILWRTGSPVFTAAINELDPGIGTVVETITDTVTNAQPGMWHVEEVVDGDTIRVRQNGQSETVRLIGIDTPETHDPRKPVQCFGLAAAAYSKQLLQGSSVRLEPDPEDSDRDKYQRLLRYVYLPDGTLVNAQLIRVGYAFAYVIFPYTKLDAFKQLEAEARDQNRGLWRGCNVDDATDIKQTTTQK